MSFPNIDWDFPKLQELIDARGDEVIVETGVACTCRREDVLASMVERENQPSSIRQLYCIKCQGDGYIYRNARCIKGLITSIEAGPARKLLESGYAVQGDAIFSPSLDIDPLSDFDKITFLHDNTVGEGQVILRNAANLGENATRTTGVSRSEDRLWYQAACSYWCEDENGVVYSQDTDFILKDRLIRWIGNKPADGIFYTLKYSAYLEWIIYNTPLQRIDRDRSLGQRVLIRKKHVALSVGSPADTVEKRIEEQETLTTRVKI